MQLKQNIHLLGGLNRDDDPRFLPDGDYIELKNARTGSPDEQQDEGLAVSMKEVILRQKTTLYSGVRHLGLAVDIETQRTYVMLWHGTTQGFIIEEYSALTNVYDKILQVTAYPWGMGSSTRFIKPRVVHGNLVLTDNVNPPKLINIERARTSLDTGVGYGSGAKPVEWTTKNFIAGEYCYYVDKFYIAISNNTGHPPSTSPTYWTELCDIVDAYASMDSDVFYFEASPPLIAAIPAYQSDSDLKINNIRGSVYQFSYRYVYMDYRKSTYAPPSEIASPDGEETDGGLINKDISLNNSIKVTLSAPGPDVRTIEVIGRSSEDPFSWFIIEKVDIVNENGDRSAGYDLTVDIFWYNDRVRSPVHQSEVYSLFTYVPIKAKLIEIIEGNRVVFANITEGYGGVRPLVTTELSYTNLIPIATNYSMVIDPAMKEVGPAGYPNDIIWVLKTTLPAVGEVGATYKVTIHPDGESELSAQYTMVGGDVATYPTSVKTALSVVMAAAGMDMETCPAGASPTWICTYQKQIPMTTDSYAGWSYSAEVISPTYLNKYQHLKFGATHKTAVIYRDHGGRICSIIRDVNFDISIPFYTENTSANMNTIPVVDMYLSHLPPSYAKSFEIIYAGNDSVQKPLQLKATGWTVDGNYWKFHVEETQNMMYEKRSGWKVPVYEWAEGDRVRLIGLSDGVDSVTEANNVLVDLEITKVEGTSPEYLFVQATTDISIPAVGALYIIEIYTPVKALSETIYWTTGMTFNVETNGAGYKYHEGDTDQVVNTSGVTTTPARVRITAHDVWKFRRINYNNAGTSTFTFWCESSIPSDWNTTQKMTSQGLPIPEIEGAGQVTLEKRWRWGGSLIPDSRVNSIATFAFDSFKDMQEQYGPITGIREVGFVLKVVQHHKVSSAYIGRVESYNAAGDPYMSFTTNVIGTIRPSQENYGCQDPESIEIHDRHMYFWDQKYGVIIRDAPNGMIPISDAKMKRYFLDKAKEINDSVSDIEVVMGYNSKAGELWVSFRILQAQAETVVFNERRKRWVFTADNYVDEYWSIGRRFFAEYALRTEEYDDEDVTAYLNWSNIEADSEVEVEVVGNIEMMKQKIHNALSVYSNLEPTCDKILIPAEASEAEKETELHSANWNKREGIWYGQILRDKNTPGVFADDTDRELNGRVMRGEYAQITLKWDSTTEQLKLFGILVFSTPSERSR